MSSTKKEGLFTRWSRLKRESVEIHDKTRVAPSLEGDESVAQGTAAQPERGGGHHDDDSLPQLPPLEELGPDSDFQAFMDPGVDDKTRSAALKALFRDPAFNVTDGLDVYAADYSKLEKLTPAMVAALRYAQRHLFGEQDQAERAGVTNPSGEKGGLPEGDEAANGDARSAEPSDVETSSLESVPGAGDEDDRVTRSDRQTSRESTGKQEADSDGESSDTRNS
jgi:hypothetical protein